LDWLDVASGAYPAERRRCVGAVVGGSLPDIEPAETGVAAPAGDTGGRSGRRLTPLRRARRRSPEPKASTEGRKRRRTFGSAIVKTLRKFWIPLVVLAVIGAGGLTVSRLHGIFGSEKSQPYSDTKANETKPFNPKQLRYEIFGAPGTSADISYFDGNGEPQHQEGVSLPWTLEFPITTAAGIGSIAAQGDSDRIGCRILVDNEVKSEKIVDHEVSAFTSCLLKAA
jgi:hypothetical protein